jgi:hypothetical protein
MEPKEILAATNERLTELLLAFDASERADRTRRLREVNEILAAAGGERFWHSGGDEASWLLAEAKNAYVYGLPIASMFASHAACERRLAGILAALPDDRVPPAWQGWGLGKLTDWALEEAWLQAPLVGRVRRLTERRKTLGHYRRPGAKDSVIRRAVNEADATGTLDVDIAAALEADALDGLSTASDLYSALSGLM